jgi:hypothetical protein
LLKRFLQCGGWCYGVLNAGIHALATGGTMDMRGVAGQQNSALPQNLGDAVLQAKSRSSHDVVNGDGGILRSALFKNPLKVCNGRFRRSVLHRRNNSEVIAGQSHDDEAFIGKE